MRPLPSLPSTPWTGLAGLWIRPLAAADLADLRRWRSMPDVRRWWGDPEGLEARLAPRIAGRDPTRPFVVGGGEGPIGFLQATAGQDGALWLDFHLADAVPRRRGAGRTMLAAAAAAFGAAGARDLRADPEAENVASCRALAAVGFRPLGTCAHAGRRFRILARA